MTTLEVDRAVDVRPLVRRTALQYRPDIDGLRALAVLLVIGYHAFPGRVSGGFVGVDVFFVISGFLITRIIATESLRGSFSFLDFYLRRCRRIFPALGVVLLGTWIVGFCTLTAPEFRNLGTHIFAGSTFAANFLLWSQTGYFDGPATLKPLLHLWSLGIEEQYYLVWPLILTFLLKKDRFVLSTIVTLVAASLLLNLLVTPAHADASFYLLPMRFWELLAGGVLGFLEAREGQGRSWLSASGWRSHVYSLLGVGLILASAALIGASDPYPGWRAVAPVLGSCLLVLAGPTGGINRLLSIRPAVVIGLISYPLYLWHWPLLSIFNVIREQLEPGPVTVNRVKLLLIAVAFLLSFATYYWVELPVQSRAKRAAVSTAARARLIAVFVAVLLAVGLLGVTTRAEGGFISRHQVLDPAHFQQEYQDSSLQFFDAAINRFAPCNARYRDLAADLWCYQSAPGSVHTDIALIGDSHARALFPGLAEEVEARGQGHVLLASRCAPLMGIAVADQPQCLAENAAIVRELSADAAVHTVVLASRGPLYISGTGFGQAEAGIGKVLQAPGGSAAEGQSMASLFLDGYLSTIEALQNAGKRVVFVVDVPELGFFPDDCLFTRPYQRSTASLRRPCAVPLESVAAREKEYRSIVQRLSALRPGLEVFDTTPLLCDGGHCYAARDEHFFYADNNHLGLYGSQVVGGALGRFLAAGPRASESRQ